MPTYYHTGNYSTPTTGDTSTSPFSSITSICSHLDIGRIEVYTKTDGSMITVTSHSEQNVLIRIAQRLLDSGVEDSRCHI